jgi:predicted nucleic acid-binding protein
MIIADTDILSALAKIDRVSILYSLFQRTVLYITPGVFKEIEHSYTQRRQYAIDLFALLSGDQIEMTPLTPAEMAWKDTLPGTLGAGERESIAIAKARAGTVLSNESRVAHFCQQHHISCLRLPDILRALWVEDVVPKPEVQEMLRTLQIKDRMQFRSATVQAIFAEP